MTDIDIDNETETETPQTPEQLLTNLGELHTRTIVSPMPKHPAAMGWQAVAGTMAAGFTRALHALNEVAPEKAAEIAVWYDGPFGEGPDSEEHTDWLERNVAKDVAEVDRWVEDGCRLAEKSNAATAAREAEELKPLTDIVKDLAHKDPCRINSDGDCHEHYWFCSNKPCPHGRAQALFPDIKES